MQTICSLQSNSNFRGTVVCPIWIFIFNTDQAYSWGLPYIFVNVFCVHTSVKEERKYIFAESRDVSQQKQNSWTDNFVEVSGQNLESSQTWGLRIQYLHFLYAAAVDCGYLLIFSQSLCNYKSLICTWYFVNCKYLIFRFANHMEENATRGAICIHARTYCTIYHNVMLAKMYIVNVHKNVHWKKNGKMYPLACSWTTVTDVG